MSSDVVRFTPNILHSYPLLYEYLCGDKIDQHIRKEIVEASSYSDKNWMGTWKVMPLAISAALQVYFSVFTCAISYLCFAAGLRTWSYQLDILSEITSSDPQVMGVFTFGNDFLAPSINSYSLDAVDLYLQPSLLRKDIQDEKVRNTINPVRKILNLDKNTGLCLGESRWFLRHYFKTRDLFENYRDHMQALGRQFSWGAPPQAALLQKLCPYAEVNELVGLLEDTDLAIIIYDDESYAKKTKYKKIAEEFQNLQPGAYLIGVPQHAMAYVCVQPGEGYFFDPNLGTAAIHDQEGYDNLAKIVLFYHKDEGQADNKLCKLSPKLRKLLTPKLCELTPVYPI